MQALFFVLLVWCGPLWLQGCVADVYEDEAGGYSDEKATASLVNLEVFTRLDITPCSGIQLPRKKYFFKVIIILHTVNYVQLFFSLVN